jgi:hypothetical protein
MGKAGWCWLEEARALLRMEWREEGLLGRQITLVPLALRSLGPSVSETFAFWPQVRDLET